MIGGVNFEIKQFLWFKDESKNSDKIWGYVNVEGKTYTFWGRRADMDSGKRKLSFKRFPGQYGGDEAANKAREKRRNGYEIVDSVRNSEGEYTAIESKYQGFTKSFKNQLMLARLTGKVLGEEV